MRSSFATVLVALTIALAGCSGGNDGGAPADTSGPLPTPTVAPEPVSIRESGSLDGLDRTYNWTVAPGHQSVSVQFEVFGPAGTPQYTLAGGFHYELVAGNGQVLHKGQSTGGGGLVSSGNQCLVCYERGPGQAAPGEWRLLLQFERAVADYDLRIGVTY